MSSNVNRKFARKSRKEFKAPSHEMLNPSINPLLRVHCIHCWHLNAVPTARIYDGFEGDFFCEQCGAPLEHLHAKLEEE